MSNKRLSASAPPAEQPDIATVLRQCAEQRGEPALVLSPATVSAVFSIPPSIAQCTALETLRLESLAVSTIPPELCTLPKLRRLAIVDCAVTRLPDALARLPSLQELRMERNRMQVLSPSLLLCTKLQVLEICQEGLDVLPVELRELQQLHTLRVTDNVLTAISTAVCTLPRLRLLDMHSNRILLVPSAVQQLAATLVDLRLSSNSITELPEEVGELLNLERLYIGRNQLTTLPASLGALQRLKVLDASYNALTDLPDSIAAHSSLSVIMLRNNRFTMLPPPLLQLPNAVQIDLRENRIGAIARLGAAKLTSGAPPPAPLSKLTLLDLGGNPELLLLSTDSLPRLQQLLLSSTACAAVPDSLFRDAPQLRVLDLRGCAALQQLPATISSADHLECLWLDGAGVRALPEAITDLNPDVLKQLTVPAELQVPPADVARMGLQAIANWFCDAQTSKPERDRCSHSRDSSEPIVRSEGAGQGAHRALAGTAAHGLP